MVHTDTDVVLYQLVLPLKNVGLKFQAKEQSANPVFPVLKK